MITELDVQVGRVVAELEKKGLRDNTHHPLRQRQRRGDQRALRARAPRATRRRAPTRAASCRRQKPPASNAPFSGGKGSLKEGGVRVPAFVNWPAVLKPRVVTEPLHMVDVMPTLLALAGGKGSPDHPFDGRDMWATLGGDAPSPQRGYPDQRRGLPRRHPQGRLEADQDRAAAGQDRSSSTSSRIPARRPTSPTQHPEIVQDLEARLLAYAKEQKPSLWLMAQPGFLGAQGKTILDPDFDIDDSGLPREKPTLPGELICERKRTRRKTRNRNDHLKQSGLTRRKLVKIIMASPPGRRRSRRGESNHRRPRRAGQGPLGSVLPFPAGPDREHRRADVAGIEACPARRAEPPSARRAEHPDRAARRRRLRPADTFGGEVHTPTLTRLADEGVAFNAVPHHLDLLADPRGAADRAQPPARRLRHDRRAGARLRRLHRRHPEERGDGRRGAARIRLQDLGLRQMAQHAGDGNDRDGAVRPLADRLRLRLFLRLHRRRNIAI